MTADQPPLWTDGWEAEADRRAGIDPDEISRSEAYAPHPKSRDVDQVEVKGDLL